jgi:CRISPR-associated protein Cas1
MAELNVLLLVCNQKFEPVCITLPYYRPTNTKLLRRQVKWTDEWKTAQWRQIISAKVANQAAVLQTPERVHRLLRQIADRCAHPPPATPVADLSRITETQRDAHRSWTPDACESRAGRHYWKHFFKAFGNNEHRRQPRTREGINGLLDYGYAILRTAVLRRALPPTASLLLSVSPTPPKPAALPLPMTSWNRFARGSICNSFNT